MKKYICIILSIAFVTATLASCRSNASTADTTTDGISVPASAVTAAETENNVKTVHFAAAGDNLIHECVYLDAMSRAAKAASTVDSKYSKYYFKDMYAGVADIISGADVAFVNQEGPVCPEYSPSGYPAFNAPVEAGETLVDLGFDIVNLANNHMLDRGTKGYQYLIDYWKTQNIMTVGAYESSSDYNNIRVYEENGIKIAVLSFTYGTNGSKLDSGSSLVIPYIDDATITSRITEVKTSADIVAVSMHWGEENTQTPNSEQKRLAQLIADAGADVVIGHHSHTLQPYEWLVGKNGKKTLVYYSLGNLISTALYSYNIVGGIAQFDIVENPGDTPYITNATLTPTVCHYECDKTKTDSLDLYIRQNISIYKLSDYTEELAKKHGAQNWGSFTLDTLKGYAANLIK